MDSSESWLFSDVFDCSDVGFVTAAVDGPVGVPSVPFVADVPDGPVVPPAALELDSVPVELDDEPSEFVGEPGSATAIPGLLAIAAPTPNATANAPILPMNRAYTRLDGRSIG